MTHFQCTRHFRPGKVVTQELPYPVLGKRCSPGLSPRRRNKTTFLQDPSFSTCLTPTRLTVSFTADKTAVLSLNFNSPDQPRPTQNVEANAFRTAKSKRPAPGGCPATGLASGGAGSHRPLAPPGGARALPASAPLPGATAQGRGAQGAGGGGRGGPTAARLAGGALLTLWALGAAFGGLGWRDSWEGGEVPSVSSDSQREPGQLAKLPQILQHRSVVLFLA